MLYDVFISHSSTDKNVADIVCAFLERNQIRCMIAPRDLLPGDEFSEVLCNEIGNCSVFLLILSKNSDTSSHVRSELSCAKKWEKRIVPIRIEEIEPEALYYHIGSLHRLDAMPPLQEHHLKKILEAVKKNIANTIQSELTQLQWKMHEENERRSQQKRQIIVGMRFADVGNFFKDRTTEISQLHQFLSDKTIKMINIIGRTWFGKTWLLSKVMEEIESRKLVLSKTANEIGVDGIVYYSCEGSDKPVVERLFHDFGQVLGGFHKEELQELLRNDLYSFPDKIRFLFSKLSHGYYLLALDSMEYWLADDYTIADDNLQTFIHLCLTTPHGLKVITTSQKRVLPRSTDLRVIRTVSLTEGLPEPDAINFLREQDPQGDLGLRESSDAILRNVAQQCCYLPKLLEKTASILSTPGYEHLSIQQLIANKELFNEQVLENLIAEHYRCLSNEHRHVLEGLAIYNKVVPVSALRYLLLPFFPAVDVENCLSFLVANGLALSQRGSYKFELSRLDRQYVYNCIPHEGEDYNKTALHERAAKFYAEISFPEKDWKSIDYLEPKLDEFQHLVYAKQYDRAARVINDIDANYLSYWGFSMLIIDLRSQLKGVLTNPELEYNNWHFLGVAHRNIGDASEAKICHERALEIANKLNHLEEKAIQLGALV